MFYIILCSLICFSCEDLRGIISKYYCQLINNLTLAWERRTVLSAFKGTVNWRLLLSEQ